MNSTSSWTGTMLRAAVAFVCCVLGALACGADAGEHDEVPIGLPERSPIAPTPPETSGPGDVKPEPRSVPAPGGAARGLDAALFYPLKTERFEGDLSRWRGIDNEIDTRTCVDVTNDVDYRTTNKAGGSVGEIGGTFWRTPAQTFIAHHFPKILDWKNRLAAKGKMVIPRLSDSSPFVGWFHREDSVHWRPRNMLGFRFERMQDGLAKAYVDYTTNFNRSGGLPTKIMVPLGQPLTWAIEFLPNAGGSMTLTINGQSETVNLQPGHVADNAFFTSFGAFTIMVPGGEAEFYLDDILLNTGELFTFDSGRTWDGKNLNEVVGKCEGVVESFGIRNNGALAAHSLGGVVYRYDLNKGYNVQFFDTLTRSLDASKGLYVEGKLLLPIAMTDADAFFGWYNGAQLDRREGVGPNQFAGIAIGGNSRDGILLSPTLITPRSRFNPNPATDDVYRIRPSRSVVTFALRIEPADKTIRMTVDGKPFTFALPPNFDAGGLALDRFGLMPVRNGGHWMEIYFDDLRYSH